MTTEDQLKNTAENLRTQDNRCTADPMFCVQIKVRDCGYDTQHADNECWWNPELLEVAYDQEPDGDEWEGPYGYKDRWETVMVAFTQAGCEEYLELNGHNDRRRAHNREVRIYAESFQRCPEMLAIRAFLLQLKAREEAAVQCPKAADYIEKLERELAEARELHRKALSEREATEKEVDAMLERLLKAERERNEARELAQELLDALSKLVALNAKMTSDDCTYERAYYCYYKGHYDKWKLATEAIAKAKEETK